MTNILKAIKKINPNAKFTINADDIDQITWKNFRYNIWRNIQKD